MSSFLSYLYIFQISPLLDVLLMKIISYSVGCHFVLLMVTSDKQNKLFSFIRSHLLIVYLVSELEKKIILSEVTKTQKEMVFTHL